MTVYERRYRRILPLLLALLLGLFFLHLATGFHYFTKGELLSILFFGGSAEERMTVFDFRMVRSLLAVLIGMGLALSGAIFQTVSKNELASPGLLGVNAGAGLAMIALVYFSLADTGADLWIQPLTAVAGGLLAAFLIYRLTYRKGERTSLYTLVLNGIAVSAGLHALQLLLIVGLDPNKFREVNVWLIGSIASASWPEAALLAAFVTAAFLYFLAHHGTLDLLTLTEESAIGLGVLLNRARLLYLMAAVALASVCVAIGGSIGFVGLIAPHIARHLVGVRHRRLLPVTALVGGILLIASDYAARTVIAPDEMLVGLIVALIGAPYFLYILARSKG